MDLPDATLFHPRSDDAQASADEAWLREMLVDEIRDLTRLAKIGMEVAEAAGLRARAELSDAMLSSESEPEAAPAAAQRAFDLTFGRVSRAVRLTYARRALSIENLRRFNDDRRAAARTAQAEQRRAAVLRGIVEGVALEGDAEDGAEAGDREIGEREREVAETCERLSESDDFGDLRGRPLSDDVAEACRLLGLSPDWSRLAKTPWARREMASGKVGEPLAAIKAEADAAPKSLIRVEFVEPPPRPPGSWSPPESPSEREPPPNSLSASPSMDWPPAPRARPAPPDPVWLPGEGPPPRRRRA